MHSFDTAFSCSKIEKCEKTPDRPQNKCEKTPDCRIKFCHKPANTKLYSVTHRENENKMRETPGLKKDGECAAGRSYAHSPIFRCDKREKLSANLSRAMMPEGATGHHSLVSYTTSK
jgi:hypothetical protein